MKLRRIEDDNYSATQKNQLTSKFKSWFQLVFCKSKMKTQSVVKKGFY